MEEAETTLLQPLALGWLRGMNCSADSARVIFVWQREVGVMGLNKNRQGRWQTAGDGTEAERTLRLRPRVPFVLAFARRVRDC